MKLLKDLCKIHAPSGEELAIQKFILQYIKNNQNNWYQEFLEIRGDSKIVSSELSTCEVSNNEI